MRIPWVAFVVIGAATGAADAGEYCENLAEVLKPGQIYAAKCARSDCLYSEVLSPSKENTLYVSYKHIIFIPIVSKDTRNSLVVVQTKYLKADPPSADDGPPQSVQLQRDAIPFGCSPSFEKPFPATRNRFPTDAVTVDLEAYQRFHITNIPSGRVGRRLRTEFHGIYDAGSPSGAENCVLTLTQTRRQQYLFYDREKVRSSFDNIVGGIGDFLWPPAQASMPSEFRRYESLAVSVKGYQRTASNRGCIEFEVDSARSAQIDLVIEDLEEKAGYSVVDGAQVRNYRLRYVNP